MCLSTIYVVSGGGHEEVMRDVARIQAESDGFWLFDLFGEKKFIRGRIKRVNFLYEHTVVIEESGKE
jgi:predicted RNA-binding protein